MPQRLQQQILPHIIVIMSNKACSMATHAARVSVHCKTRMPSPSLSEPLKRLGAGAEVPMPIHVQAMPGDRLRRHGVWPGQVASHHCCSCL